VTCSHIICSYHDETFDSFSLIIQPGKKFPNHVNISRILVEIFMEIKQTVPETRDARLVRLPPLKQH
jgi:hypothetical protein